MKPLFAILVFGFASTAFAEEVRHCAPETDAAIQSMLTADPNAPGKEIVGDRLQELLAACEAEQAKAD